jgi:translation initiation factor 1
MRGIMARASKKIFEKSGDISLGGERDAKVSIGEMTGRATPESSHGGADGENRREPENSPRNAGGIFRDAILRRETAGRGGRTVTAVEPRPPLDAPGAADLAREMRKSLGCGSRVEGNRIILQGDVRDRAEAWLAKQGVKKITRGN